MGNYGHRPDPNTPSVTYISSWESNRRDSKGYNFDIRNLAILFFLGMKLRCYQGITMFQHCDTTNKFDLLPLK